MYIQNRNWMKFKKWKTDTYYKCPHTPWWWLSGEKIFCILEYLSCYGYWTIWATFHILLANLALPIILGWFWILLNTQFPQDAWIQRPSNGYIRTLQMDRKTLVFKLIYKVTSRYTGSNNDKNPPISVMDIELGSFPVIFSQITERAIMKIRL